MKKLNVVFYDLQFFFIIKSLGYFGSCANASVYRFKTISEGGLPSTFLISKCSLDTSSNASALRIKGKH